MCESHISFDGYSYILSGFVRPTCLSYGCLTPLLYEESFQYPGSVHADGKQVFVFDELMRVLDRSRWGSGQRSKRNHKLDAPPPIHQNNSFYITNVTFFPPSSPSLLDVCLVQMSFGVTVEICMFVASVVDINNQFIWPGGVLKQNSAAYLSNWASFEKGPNRHESLTSGELDLPSLLSDVNSLRNRIKRYPVG